MMTYDALPDKGWWPKGMFGPLLPALDGLLGAVMVELLLYGIHLIVFSLCFYILLVRKRRTQLVILVAAVLMFALSTADIALSFCLAVRDVPAFLNLDIGVAEFVDHMAIKNFIFVFNNLIADLLLLYRCYVIWGRKKLVIFLSTPLLLADTAWGVVSAGPSLLSLERKIKFEQFYIWSVFFINVVMTIATAGRIWWLARDAMPIVGRRELRRYHVATAILIESAAVYTIALLLHLALPERPWRWVVDTIVMRLVCIMPTFMIVQVELQAARERYASKVRYDDAEARAADTQGTQGTRSMQFRQPRSTLTDSVTNSVSGGGGGASLGSTSVVPDMLLMPVASAVLEEREEKHDEEMQLERAGGDRCSDVDPSVVGDSKGEVEKGDGQSGA